MKLGILILHFNTPEITKPMALSLPEAIIIDNGSDPHKRLNVPNRQVNLPSNLGFTRGWNAGIRHLYDEFDAFWLMNSDIRISRESVEEVRKACDNEDLDIFTPVYNCWMKACQPGHFDRITEIAALEFTAPIIKKRVFQKIGLMDESFSLGYGVEYDFGHRAKMAGMKMHVLPSAEFYHLGSQSIKNLGFRQYVTQAKREHTRELVKKYGKNYFDIIHKDCQMESDFSQKIVVYTTIFGDFDTLKPHAWSQINAEWWCITDNPALRCEGWKIHVVPKKEEWNARQHAKFYKVFPWEADPLKSAGISIYIDGSMQVTSESFIERMIIRLYNDMLLYKHPDRDCLFQEAIVSKSLKYYATEKLERQADHYAKEVPTRAGLWACGMLVRKHSKLIRELMAKWWDEMDITSDRKTIQDQISFAYICHVNKFKPSTLQENLWRNEDFKIIPHQGSVDVLCTDKPYKLESHMKTAVSDRIRLINSIIYSMKYETYLEVGMAEGATFLNISCTSKESIECKRDNRNRPTFNMTSDEFFKKFKGRLYYDCIFIDGDHSKEQVMKDIMNSLDCLTPGGCLVLHDTNPVNERYTGMDLCGTAYQALVELIYTPDNFLQIYTINMPDDQGNGVSVIFKGDKFPDVPTEVKKEEALTYAGFDRLRRSSESWMDEEKFYRTLTALNDLTDETS